MAGAEAEGRRESEAEAEDEWASEAEGVPLTLLSIGMAILHRFTVTANSLPDGGGILGCSLC